jgi:GNAT superfamily N-acetyltransferase
MEIIIRPLNINDASVSWKWRNNPIIWEKTGRKWNNVVTEDIEKKWIEKTLTEKNAARFAICLVDNFLYIGNVQLTDILEGCAVFHIFIGVPEYWGKGIAKKATKLILTHAKDKLKLSKIILKVKKNNLIAINLYNSLGFIIYGEEVNDFLMRLDVNDYKSES